MGAIFAERVLGVANPRVALLSIGEEKGKGDARIQRATELLDATDLNFTGNVEGKDLTTHLADVVVCDAVLGNVVIKFFEGLSTFIFDLWRAEFERSVRGRLAYCRDAPRRRPHPRRSSTTRRSAARRCSACAGRSSSPMAGRKRRMIAFACDVAATTARTRVPALIAESLGAGAGRPCGRRPQRRTT